jgi:hypothetical protein
MEEKVRVLNLIKGVKTLLGRTISIDEVESALAATPRMMAYDWFKSKVELRIKGMK